MNDGEVDELVKQVREMMKQLPTDHQAVVLIFNPEGDALCLGLGPFRESFTRVKAWVDAQVRSEFDNVTVKRYEA